jgi:DNA-directed RNA polymerase specialized sigma24 family protein
MITEYLHNPAGELTARRWLEWGYRALKPKDKALVVLHELEGWTVRELASTLKVREGTVKARLSRSRWRMRRAIERVLPDEDKRSLTRKAIYVVQKNDE